MADEIGPFYTSAKGAKDIAQTVKYVKNEIKNNVPHSRRRPASETGLRIGFLDKDSTMTACDDGTCGYGDLKLSNVVWDSTAETFIVTAADSTTETPTPTIKVFNVFNSEFVGDGTNDIKMQYQFGYGAFWLTGVDCNSNTSSDGTGE